MTINVFKYSDADDATKARTEEFFILVQKNETTNAALLTLVQQSICLEAKDGEGCTALICAAKSGRTEIVQALLTAGANIEARNDKGDTALSCAAYTFPECLHTMRLQALTDMPRDHSGWSAEERRRVLLKPLAA